MTGRRNPFAVSRDTAQEKHVRSIYDSLSVAAPRTRSRTWERTHQDEKVVYRGVDPQLALQVKTIAGELRVPAGEVARALIEHALGAYAEGDLDLKVRPNPDRLRMTLYPSSARTGRSRMLGVSGHRKAAEIPWRVITTWRGFSPELKAEMAALASSEGLAVPIGELVSAFLRYGLKAYDSGVLKLEPIPKARMRMLHHRGDI